MNIVIGLLFGLIFDSINNIISGILINIGISIIIIVFIDVSGNKMIIIFKYEVIRNSMSDFVLILGSI